MYTRFRAVEKIHIMNDNGPMVAISPDAPGAEFLGYLGSAYQEEITVPRQSILSNARLLLAFLEEHRDVLAYRYAFEYRVFGRDDMIAKGSGAASGFLIDGLPHSIWAGNGECYLTKHVPSPDGVAHITERIDVRGRDRIATDQRGDIKIKRRKIQFTLPERLAACITFLESVSDQPIGLYSYDKPPTLRQVLREFADGGGKDDWAIEEIGQGGPDAKAQLLDALTDRAFRKYRAAIIQLLLLCHPGDDTQEAIEQFIEGEPARNQRDYWLLVWALTEGKRGTT